MRRFRALIKKEMIHMLRDPRTLVFIFLMPIMQLVLLGFVNNTDIRNVPTVVFNQDIVAPAAPCWIPSMQQVIFPLTMLFTVKWKSTT